MFFQTTYGKTKNDISIMLSFEKIPRITLQK